MEASFSSAECFQFGGGIELPGSGDEDSVGLGYPLEIIEEGFFLHAGLRLPFFAEDVRGCCDNTGNFEASDQSHFRAGDIDEDEIAWPDLWADSAEFDGFRAGEDEIRVLRLDGH